MIYQLKHFSPQRKQIYSEASLTHFSAINLSYTYSLPIIILIDPNKSQTFQKTIRVIAEHNSIWHCDLLIKTLLASQRNQIYSEASSTHFSAVNLWYTYALPIIILIDPNKSQTFQKTISVIAEHNSIWHFVIIQSKHFSPLIWHNLTLCDLPIKILLAFQRKQIYSEASLTHFSAINLSYTYFVIIQSKHFSPLNAIKYILKHLQHTFQLLIYDTLTLYPS